MGANRRASEIARLLDKRSYRVYRMRTNEKKSFREIGAVIGRSSCRARQLYEASIKRIELKKAGGDKIPEYSLSVRALNRIHWAFQKTDVTRREIVRALKTGKLHPDQVFGYGWKTHREVCKWAGVAKQTSEL